MFPNGFGMQPMYNPMGIASPQGIPPAPGFDSIRAAFNQEVSNRLALRELEWLYAIPAHIVIPAESGADDTLDIKSDAHFECYFVTGSYTTLDDDEGVFDSGVCEVSMRITDGSNDLKLFNNFIPANLFLSPGRRLANGTSGDPASSLFYPFPFYHIFPANGGIVIETQNAAAAENTLDLLFWGKKLRAQIGDAAA